LVDHFVEQFLLPDGGLAFLSVVGTGLVHLTVLVGRDDKGHADHEKERQQAEHDQQQDAFTIWDLGFGIWD